MRTALPTRLALLAALALAAACGGKKGEAILPLVTPPVRAATPAALRASGSALVVAPGTVAPALSASDLKDRFFSAGPTNIFGILASIDGRISGLNQQAIDAPDRACLTQAPVPYTVTPWGQPVTLWAQCAQEVSIPADAAGAPHFVQWGAKDGVVYLWDAVGAEHVAVIATPNGAGGHRVQAWIGLGYTNAHCGPGTWDGCSYGVMQLEADAAAGTFELAVAGMGFGYCGAQLRSDGTSVWAEGSGDMGTTCGAAATACVGAADLSASTACTAGSSVTAFALPALGRASAQGSNVPPISGQVFGESAYPAAGPTVSLDGTATDDLAFGPSAPVAGVGIF